jgi:hypothetical protein
VGGRGSDGDRPTDPARLRPRLLRRPEGEGARRGARRRARRPRRRRARARCLRAPPTLADAALLPAFWLLRDLTDDFPRRLPLRRWPRWIAWYERMRARADVAAVLADADA